MWNPGIGFISTTEAPFLVRRVVWWCCVWSYRRAPHRLQRPQSVYSYGALAFVVATVVWVVACLRTKAQGHCIILQLKMLVLPPLKAVALLVAYLQWAEKADGEPVGQWSTGMAPFAALTNVAYRAAFFECLMVLAKGMCNVSGVAGAQGVTASYVPCVPCRRLAYHASVHHKGRAPGAWVCVPATYREWLRLTRVCVCRCAVSVCGVYAPYQTMLCSVSVYAAAKLVFQLWGGALGSVALLSALVLTVAYVLVRALRFCPTAA